MERNVPEAGERAAGAGRAGRLYVVGTPIGNLGDLTPRAGEAFRAADLVCCEDTRVTAKLLNHLGVQRPLMRCDENVMDKRAAGLVERMLAGDVIAYASDAGMPGVSDPGQVLVDAAHAAGVGVEVVPGPSACITALVSSGIACDHFFFEGFLPRRAQERSRRLRTLAAVPGALIFYESPHRVEAALAAIAEAYPTRTVALCRELTKLHEEVLRAPAPELIEEVRSRGTLKGEMVIVVAPPDTSDEGLLSGGLSDEGDAVAAALDPDQLLRGDIARALEENESPSAIAKRLSQRYSRRRREVYALVLEIRGSAPDDPE